MTNEQRFQDTLRLIDKQGEEINRLKEENKKLKDALEAIRFSALSTGWAGDGSTEGDHVDYTWKIAAKALGRIE